MMTPTRPSLNAGTPDLLDNDLPGTALLLTGKTGPDSLALAKVAQRRRAIEAARRKALRPHGAAWKNIRVTSLAGEDPASDKGAAAVEARDLLAAILRVLSPEEARILRLRAADADHAEVARQLGVSQRTAETRWARLRAKVLSLFPL